MTTTRHHTTARALAYAVSSASLAVLALNATPAMAGAPSAWPSRYPLPTNPGHVVSQTSTTAVPSACGDMITHAPGHIS